jgi:hypothetical protein
MQRIHDRSVIVYTVGLDECGAYGIIPWEVQDFPVDATDTGATPSADPMCISLAESSSGEKTPLLETLSFEEAKRLLLGIVREQFDKAVSIRPYDRVLGALEAAPKRILVTIESPFAPVMGPEAEGLSDQEYAAAIEGNVTYARACCHDCLLRGESPYATHLFFTQEGMLDDRIPAERELGIASGLDWASRADKTAVYVDRGISPGMRRGIERARTDGREIVYRSLERNMEWGAEPVLEMADAR